MIPLNPHRAAFGRHETFPLRFGWLTKGFAAWRDNRDIFDQEDSTVVLGVGKNMVNAIKYWMTAAQIVTAHGASVSETELGRAIFARDGWDPYVEDDSTLWLLHWLIASNAADATATYWFFNHFHKPEFTSPEVAKALEEFCREKISTRFSASTLKHDVALILRMYQRSEVARGVPLEDTLDSPLSLLGLVQAPRPGAFINRDHLRVRVYPSQHLDTPFSIFLLRWANPRYRSSRSRAQRRETLHQGRFFD